MGIYHRNHKHVERDAYLDSVDISIYVEGNKLVGVGIYDGDKKWRSFAYFKGTNKNDAKTSILMEWKEFKRLRSLNESSHYQARSR
jgi:hypothetical protein